MMKIAKAAAGVIFGFVFGIMILNLAWWIWAVAPPVLGALMFYLILRRAR
jgi:hypothetical protein